MAAALDFPDCYGRNLDALNDCMRNVVDHDYGWAREATGLVLVFDGYLELEPVGREPVMWNEAEWGTDRRQG